MAPLVTKADCGFTGRLPVGSPLLFCPLSRVIVPKILEERLYKKRKVLEGEALDRKWGVLEG